MEIVEAPATLQFKGLRPLCRNALQEYPIIYQMEEAMILSISTVKSNTNKFIYRN